MRLLRTLLALCLATTLAVVPAMALALDTQMHGAHALTASGPGTESSVEARSAHDDCDMHASSDADGDRHGHKSGHCGLCCLAHSTFALPKAEALAEPILFLAPPIPGGRVNELDLEHRIYGLKRPPRA